MLISKNIWGVKVSTYYVGEGNGEGQGQGKEGQGKEGEDEGKLPEVLTKEAVDKHLAGMRKKYETKISILTTDLEAIKGNSKLSQQEREALEHQIESLNSTFKTQVELKEEALTKAQKKHKTDLDTLTSERDSWKTRYTNETIDSALLSAAAENDAFSPFQIVTLLRGVAVLEDELDVDTGKATGKFGVRVNLNTVDKDGKPITLKLTAPEAVKKMQEMPDMYGNLFKSGVTSGTGARPVNGKPAGPINYKGMTADKYRKLRKENPSAIFGNEKKG